MYFSIAVYSSPILLRNSSFLLNFTLQINALDFPMYFVVSCFCLKQSSSLPGDVLYLQNKSVLVSCRWKYCVFLVLFPFSEQSARCSRSFGRICYFYLVVIVLFFLSCFRERNRRSIWKRNFHSFPGLLYASLFFIILLSFLSFFLFPSPFRKIPSPTILAFSSPIRIRILTQQFSPHRHFKFDFQYH